VKYTKSSGQTRVGLTDWFTGTVFIDGIRNPDEQSAVGCSHVRFAPGARTAWHHHPKGQTLTSPTASASSRRNGSGVQEIRPGDVVYIGTRRGALARRDAGYRFMAHVANQEADDDGQVVTWLEHVTDEEYGRR